MPQYEKECCGQHDHDGDHQVNVGQRHQELISLFWFSFLVMVIFNVLCFNNNSYPPLHWDTMYYDARNSTLWIKNIFVCSHFQSISKEIRTSFFHRKDSNLIPVIRFYGKARKVITKRLYFIKEVHIFTLMYKYMQCYSSAEFSDPKIPLWLKCADLTDIC